MSSNEEERLLDACDQGQLEEAEALLESGVSPDTQDEGAHSALHLAAMRGHLALVKLLVERGARLESTAPPKGYEHLKIGNALFFAAGGGYTDTVDYLAGEGADINCVSPMGMTPVMLAAQQGYPDVVAVLIKRKADLQVYDLDGMTAVHYAAAMGYAEALRLLLEAGMDVNVRTRPHGYTPLDLVLHNQKGDHTFADSLKERGAKTGDELGGEPAAG